MVCHGSNPISARRPRADRPLKALTEIGVVIGSGRIGLTSTTSFDIGAVMTQITARLPESVVEALDAAATHLRRSRAEVVRQAIERYLEDFDDLW